VTHYLSLELRTRNFSISIIELIKTINITLLNRAIISQLLRSSTSIGANYCEASESESRKDFVHKIYVCRKEARETKYWLNLLAQTNPEKSSDLRELWKETHEILLILASMSRVRQAQRSSHK